MSSFSKKTKEDLCNITVKNDCCKRALLLGIIAFGAKYENGSLYLITECEDVALLTERLILECYEADCLIEYYGNGYRISAGLDLVMRLPARLLLEENCASCRICYLRGAFLASGSVNSPESDYRLELVARSRVPVITEIFDSIPVNYLTTTRGKDKIVYIKDSESIEDILNYIGAKNSAFSIMNEKIMREIRNEVNRRQNFDMANISKTIAASQLHVDAINKLKADNRLAVLPKKLQETAHLRVKYPDASLSDLAELHEPKITKSGLNNRLKKILEYSEK